MAGEFVNPNLHAALVHFPIGLLIVGTLIELFSVMWRRSAFRVAGRWMILLGALSGIPTALSGIYALADVSIPTVPAVEPWKDAVAESAVWQNHESAHMLRDHVLMQSLGVALAVLVSLLWMGSSDTWRNRLHVPLLALLVVACGVTVAGAWHGGEAVYRHGVGVFEPESATQPSLAESIAHKHEDEAAGHEHRLKWDVKYYLPPLQTHVILAGATIAVALAALGLSMRAATGAIPQAQVDYIAEVLGPPGEQPTPASRDRPLPEPPDRTPRIPAARFWLLAVLLGLAAALAGDWVLAEAMETWDPKALWEQIKQPVEGATYPWLTRRLAHVGGGVAIIALSLLMALVARMAPRAKFVLLLVALLLLGLVAAQIWFGVLLMFDSVQGPVTGFN